ncbi:iron-containing alcohol dehydrogenase [Pasteurella bettyae]|uniref:Alcohol dehydrogenase, iron-dependent n=1 Tax=Pasteurella bettyae CCUG 2042 TaxID=1095749 RepID=I3D7X8_9PAST|nr:iron-containing alcohol dehydrogenase [Pasteurella bettyae]EIJ67821.1 alcohol dehydrogenase, iron-dependent [Pasteurella bettyae CCUG 2042]SUB22113.1 alcohol dehydrogenase YqhD [Pasteurella bettyae]
MFNFTFHIPTAVEFGKGQIQAIPKYLSKQNRILLVYGSGSIKKNGVYDQVIHALQDYFYIEFAGIEPNPEFETLNRAVQVVKRENIDFILAVGGGSVLDGCKFIASAATYSGDALDILYKKQEIIRALPIGTVMTIPATGSEMNGNFVVSRRETKDKLSLYSDLVKPKFAILDPSVTYSLPQKQTANGVVDAFVHTFEQYMTYPVDAKIPDRFAEGVFCTLMEDGPKLLDEPENYDARANIMWAATMALNKILSTGVPQDWTSHAIGHELTALYGLDHGQTLAIIVPAIMHHQKQAKREKLIQFAQRVLDYRGNDVNIAAELTIQKICAFFELMGVKTRFSDYGIDDSLFPEVIRKLSEHRQPLLGEHESIDHQAVMEILYLAL